MKKKIRDFVSSFDSAFIFLLYPKGAACYQKAAPLYRSLVVLFDCSITDSSNGREC
jgi:hypothetical protein